MDPISFSLDSKEVKKVIRNVFDSLPRTKLQSVSTHYLHYTFKCKIFGFTDDAEFVLNPEYILIHFRSASRTGYSDMGVNNERMTEIGKGVNQALKSRTASK